MRVLAIDPGLTLGFAALGDGRPPCSGSRALRGNSRRLGVSGRHCDEILRQLILQERPKVIVFATPFVGQRRGKPVRIQGKLYWPDAAPVQPDSIRPLMSFMTIVEMVCDELKIRCVELDESEARRAFLGKVPKKSADIKEAVMAGCRSRGWPCTDDHAGDALCVASRALEILAPDASHEVTQLFSGPVRKPAKRRKA